MIATQLSLPTGIIETDALIQQFDTCLLTGFINLNAEQHSALQSIQRIFTGSPLDQPLTTALEAITQGTFLPEHFQKLASARIALQGAQYDHLRQHIRMALGRAENEMAVAIEFAQPTPLMNSAAHWLMDMAIAGFSRLEQESVTPFAATLAQLQADEAMMPLATLLTGFMGELIGAVPIANPDKAPLFRWVDLWSRALMMTLALPKSPEPMPVSGTLYPLGIDWRQHPRMASLVVYGVLETVDTATLVRITQSSYKVDAIGMDEQWLLFPKLALLVESLQAGKTLEIRDMPLLPTGDLLWNLDCAAMGSKYTLSDVAARYFAPNAAKSITMPQLPAHQRHPLHLAEPVFLADYTLNDWTINSGNWALQLDMRRIVDTEVTAQELRLNNAAFGLIRYDAQQWTFQPLAAVKGKGKPVFVGKDSAKILSKPPKSSTVSVLKERASRLLRGKKEVKS
jgi:hypothetical protein